MLKFNPRRGRGSKNIVVLQSSVVKASPLNIDVFNFEVQAALLHALLNSKRAKSSVYSQEYFSHLGWSQVLPSKSFDVKLGRSILCWGLYCCSSQTTLSPDLSLICSTQPYYCSSPEVSHSISTSTKIRSWVRSAQFRPIHHLHPLDSTPKE